MEERASAGVVLAVLGKAAVHVGQARTDAVLVPLQRIEVDRIGEMRGEQLVRFCFQTRPICGEVSEFLIVPGIALVERGIDVGGETLICAVVDRDRGVGIRDQTFRDRDGHGPPGTCGLLRGAARTHEVGVGGAAWVGGEIEEHAGAAAAAVQESFEVVGVLDVAGHLRRARFQE